MEVTIVRDRTRRYARTMSLGTFHSCFKKGKLPVPGYLELLHLIDKDTVPIVFERIEMVLAKGGYEDDLLILINDTNWRPHLVAAVALLLMDDASTFIESLWNMIEKSGSWVTPQLLVAAFLLDPSFEERALRRIELRCPVPFRGGHSEDVVEHSSKELGALCFLCAQSENESERSVVARSAPEVLQMVRADPDQGQEIASRWLDAVTARLNEWRTVKD